MIDANENTGNGLGDSLEASLSLALDPLVFGFGSSYFWLNALCSLPKSLRRPPMSESVFLEITVVKNPTQESGS